MGRHVAIAVAGLVGGSLGIVGGGHDEHLYGEFRRRRLFAGWEAAGLEREKCARRAEMFGKGGAHFELAR